MQDLTHYTFLFDTMTIRPEWMHTAQNAAALVKKSRAIYQVFIAKYNPAMPWYVAGLNHYMESGCNFTRHQHNGDPLSKRTINVPKGRPLAPPVNGFPPGYTWIESATDAFNLMGYAHLINWQVPDILSRLEQYNGTGYPARGINTPYLWSGTNHYTTGKYVADHQFDPHAVSKQMGAAAVLKIIINS